MPETVTQGLNQGETAKPINPEVPYRREELGLVLKLKRAEELGLEMTRGDNIETIIKEAEALGTIKEIAIDGNRSLMIFTTVAASSHTPYVCQYQVFKDIWLEMTKKNGYQSSSDKPLLAVTDEEKAFVPLHLITWACVKTKNDQGEDVYHELDIFDLVGQGRRYDKERDFTLADLDDKKRQEILEVFWGEIERRMVVHNEILNEMYKLGVLPRVIEAINISTELSQEVKTRLIDIFSQPGFPDNTVPIGHYSRYQQDKLGRGPQSVPAFHSHSAMYFLPEKIWDFIKQLPDKTDQEKDELFNQVLEIINPALGGGEMKWLTELAYEDEKIRARVPELMMKQVDPYSTIFFKAAGESYFLPKLELLLREIGINFVSMKSFIHHTDEKRKGDVRFAEGVKLTIAKADLPKFLSRFNKYLTELYQIWEIVKEIVDLKTTDNYSERERFLQILEAKHHLPKRLLKLISLIQPVGGTLYDLKVPEFQLFREFAQKELKGGIDGDKYLGYNIPGAPSMGLTITANENASLVDIWISPLFSLKGVAEQIVGLPIIRIEKKEENK